MPLQPEPLNRIVMTEMNLDVAADAFLDSTKISVTKPEKIVRKKFAVPPVKVACLECKRGGARIRKRRVSNEDEKPQPSTNNAELNACALSILPEVDEVEAFNIPLSLVTPGGGLKQLDFSLDDTDFIFDSIFTGPGENLDSGYETSEHNGTLSDIDRPKSYVRVYQSDEDILSAYYVYIHPYFPVLPAPESHQVLDNPDFGVRQAPDAIFSSRSNPNFEPSTPLSRAISASLSLIPHPDDPNPTSMESVRLRREQAQAFAQSAYESIENESELVESQTDPGEALSTDPTPLSRIPFHPQLPLENESIIALLMLSTYEYAQRGNIVKMRNRAGQAVNAALSLGLHSRGNEGGYYAEANRRTWWMTYILVCQGAILSNSSPPILLNDPRFTTSGPTYLGDPMAWSVFLQSQQAITSCTQFVIALDATMKQCIDSTTIWDRMLELEAYIRPLVEQADTWILSSDPQPALDQSERVVAQALRGMARIKLNSARIKLHRYRAFSDIPVFTKKHCDLRASASPTPSNTSHCPSNTTNSPTAPACHCSSTFHNLPTSNDLLTLPLNMNIPMPLPYVNLPYDSHYSSKICLKSAFNIASSFRSLPYPQPIRPNDPMSYFPEMRPIGAEAPRMIPVFACCAMQSSYALIMLSFKTKAMGFVGGGVGHAGSGGSATGAGESKDGQAAKLLGQLSEGLQMVLGAIRNYSIAYEALGGMCGQIEAAGQSMNVLPLNNILPDGSFS